MISSHHLLSNKKPTDTYSGFIGLNTDSVHFNNHVMNPDEISHFFSAGQRYDAPFVYPFLPADGFERPVVFSGEAVTAESFILKAEIVANKHPKSWAGWFAGKVLLPQSFIMKDQIHFFTDPAKGFGEGAFHITTIACQSPDGRAEKRAQACLSVKNRPGLFLKILDQRGKAYPDAAIFFPDKAEGAMHRPVQFGEAFVLVKQGSDVNEDMLDDIKRTFNKVVKKSYGASEGLYHIDTHAPLPPMP